MRTTLFESDSEDSGPATPRAPRFEVEPADTKSMTTRGRIDMMQGGETFFRGVKVNDRTANGSAEWGPFDASWTTTELSFAVPKERSRRTADSGKVLRQRVDAGSIELVGGIDDPIFDLLSGRPEGRNRAFQVMSRSRLSQVLGLFDDLRAANPKAFDLPELVELNEDVDDALKRKMSSPVKEKPKGLRGRGLSTTSADALVGKLSILRGSMAAGNDNKRLRKQLMDVLDQLYSMGVIDKSEYLRMAKH